MSPLAPAGTRGYVDFQRVDNWDSPLLYSDSGVSVNPNLIVGPFDVSRYAYLGGLDLIQLGDVKLRVDWAADQGGLNVTGSRTFQLTGSISDGAQYRLPNLGSWVTLFWAKISAAVPLHTSWILGTNRAYPLEFIPYSPVLIDRQNVALGAGLTDTLYPSDYYAGPVDIWLQVPAAGWLITVDYLTSADIWSTAFVAPTSTAVGNSQYKVVTPPGAWRVRVLNTSAGAGNYYLSVKHALTGSA